MFKGINFKEFLNDYKEWHALVDGFCEALCFWPPHYGMSDTLLEDLEGEYHYYVTGRALGFLALIGIIIGIAKAVF